MFTIVFIAVTGAACVAFTVYIAVRGFMDRHYVRDVVHQHTARFYRCGHCGLLHEYGQKPHAKHAGSHGGRPVSEGHGYGLPEVSP